MWEPEDFIDHFPHGVILANDALYKLAVLKTEIAFKMFVWFDPISPFDVEIPIRKKQ